MTADIWRLVSAALVIGGAVFLVGLERMFPYKKGQKFFREGFFSDFILYTFVQSYVLGVIISYGIEWIDSATGASRLHLLTGWPLWLQLAFFLVTHDMYIYWFHRLQHRFVRLWRIHEAHHSPLEVDWLSGTRSHSLEILINQTIEFAPIILLGAPPEVAVLKGAIDAVWGMYIHSNIDVHSGPLQYVLNGPEMHRWHHAADEEAYNKNFATKFALWDWIFGTAYFPRGKKPSGYGLNDENYPSSYIQQHLYAFRTFDER